VSKLGAPDWEKVGKELGGVAKAWWTENKDDLIELGREEAQEIFDDLRRARTTDAKLAIARRMTREEWKAYRDGTTARLQGIAANRARIMDALAELGSRAAEKIGKAALDAIGL